MKTKSMWFVNVLALLFVVAFFVQPVGASVHRQATATATWDIRTPPPTPIGTPDIDALFPTITATPAMECPAGTPVGYGTLTPGLNWLLTCGECLPSATATPTFDFLAIQQTNEVVSGSATPGGPTSSPTVTATVTVTPTSTPAYAGNAFEVLESNLGLRNEPYADTNLSDVSCVPALGSTGVHVVTCTGTLLANANNAFVHGGAYVEIALQAGVTGSTWYYDTEISNLSNIDTGAIFQRTHSLSGTVVSTTTTANGNYTPGGGTTVGAFVIEVYAVTTGSFSADFSITLSTDPIVITTPTPTPTAVLDYCQVIDDGEYDYESWFDLIGLTGSQTCLSTPYISAADYFGSGWTAFFSFIFPDEVTDWITSAVIPAQTFCFYGVGFVPIQLFSIMVDPTIFADMAIVLFIVAHFLNK